MSFKEFFTEKAKKRDIVDMIMDFESGELSDNEILELFSELIKTGKLKSLQGMYQRMASDLIKQGYLDKNGNILKKF